MKTSDKITDLLMALAAVQAEMPPVKANREGQVGNRKYRYADLPAVWAHWLAYGPRHGLMMFQTIMPSDGDGIRLQTRLVHLESDQWIESELEMTPADNHPQVVGSSITYNRRYQITTLSEMVVTEEDDDGALGTRGVNKVDTKSLESVKPAERTPAQRVGYFLDKADLKDEGARVKGTKAMITVACGDNGHAMPATMAEASSDEILTLTADHAAGHKIRGKAGWRKVYGEAMEALMAPEGAA